jgi:hypothetical protein
MDMPSNIKTTEANIAALDAYEDFVMRMFFIRYPRKSNWHMCLWLLKEEDEANNYTRWPAYYYLDAEVLMGEMESMLADLRRDFAVRAPAPQAVRPLSSDPVAEENARIISQQIDKDLWEIFADTTKPIPAQKPRFNLKKSN